MADNSVMQFERDMKNKYGIPYSWETQEQPQPDTGFIKGNLLKGVGQFGQMAGGALGIFGDITGSDYLKNKGISAAQGAEQYIQDINKRMYTPDVNPVDTYEKQGLWEAVKQTPQFIAQEAIKNAPMMIGTGGVGGLVGRQSLKALLARELTSAGLGEAIGKEGLYTAAKKYLPKEVLDAAAKRAGLETAAATMGQWSGLESGSIYADQPEDQKNAWKALAYGIPAGALEVLPEIHLAAKTGLGKVFTGAAKIAEPEVKPLITTGKQWLKHVGLETAKQGLEEGGQEYAQTVLEQLGAGKNPLEREQIKEQILSALAGGGIGVGLGGATHAATTRIKPVIDNKTQTDLTGTAITETDIAPSPAKQTITNQGLDTIQSAAKGMSTPATQKAQTPVSVVDAVFSKAASIAKQPNNKQFPVFYADATNQINEMVNSGTLNKLQVLRLAKAQELMDKAMSVSVHNQTTSVAAQETVPQNLGLSQIQNAGVTIGSPEQTVSTAATPTRDNTVAPPLSISKPISIAPVIESPTTPVDYTAKPQTDVLGALKEQTDSAAFLRPSAKKAMDMHNEQMVVDHDRVKENAPLIGDMLNAPAADQGINFELGLEGAAKNVQDAAKINYDLNAVIEKVAKAYDNGLVNNFQEFLAMMKRVARDKADKYRQDWVDDYEVAYHRKPVYSEIPSFGGNNVNYDYARHIWTQIGERLKAYHQSVGTYEEAAPHIERAFHAPAREHRFAELRRAGLLQENELPSDLQQQLLEEGSPEFEEDILPQEDALFGAEPLETLEEPEETTEEPTYGTAPEEYLPIAEREEFQKEESYVTGPRTEEDKHLADEEARAIDARKADKSMQEMFEFEPPTIVYNDVISDAEIEAAKKIMRSDSYISGDFAVAIYLGNVTDQAISMRKREQGDTVLGLGDSVVTSTSGDTSSDEGKARADKFGGVRVANIVDKKGTKIQLPIIGINELIAELTYGYSPEGLPVEPTREQLDQAQKLIDKRASDVSGKISEFYYKSLKNIKEGINIPTLTSDENTTVSLFEPSKASNIDNRTDTKISLSMSDISGKQVQEIKRLMFKQINDSGVLTARGKEKYRKELESAKDDSALYKSIVKIQEAIIRAGITQFKKNAHRLQYSNVTSQDVINKKLGFKKITDTHLPSYQNIYMLVKQSIDDFKSMKAVAVKAGMTEEVWNKKMESLYNTLPSSKRAHHLAFVINGLMTEGVGKRVKREIVGYEGTGINRTPIYGNEIIKKAADGTEYKEFFDEPRYTNILAIQSYLPYIYDYLHNKYNNQLISPENMKSDVEYEPAPYHEKGIEDKLYEKEHKDEFGNKTYDIVLAADIKPMSMYPRALQERLLDALPKASMQERYEMWKKNFKATSHDDIQSMLDVIHTIPQRGDIVIEKQTKPRWKPLFGFTGTFYDIQTGNWGMGGYSSYYKYAGEYENRFDKEYFVDPTAHYQIYQDDFGMLHIVDTATTKEYNEETEQYEEEEKDLSLYKVIKLSLINGVMVDKNNYVNIEDTSKVRVADADKLLDEFVEKRQEARKSIERGGERAYTSWGIFSKNGNFQPDVWKLLKPFVQGINQTSYMVNFVKTEKEWDKESKQYIKTDVYKYTANNKEISEAQFMKEVELARQKLIRLMIMQQYSKTSWVPSADYFEEIASQFKRITKTIDEGVGKNAVWYTQLVDMPSYVYGIYHNAMGDKIRFENMINAEMKSYENSIKNAIANDLLDDLGDGEKYVPIRTAISILSERSSTQEMKLFAEWSKYYNEKRSKADVPSESSLQQRENIFQKYVDTDLNKGKIRSLARLLGVIGFFNNRIDGAFDVDAFNKTWEQYISKKTKEDAVLLRNTLQRFEYINDALRKEPAAKPNEPKVETRQYTPTIIESLKENEVFVYPGNTQGLIFDQTLRHIKNAEGKEIRVSYGHKKGLDRQAYAIVTHELRKGKEFARITKEQIQQQLVELFEYAKAHPQMRFIVPAQVAGAFGKPMYVDVTNTNGVKLKNGKMVVPYNIILPQSQSPKEEIALKTLKKGEGIPEVGVEKEKALETPQTEETQSDIARKAGVEVPTLEYSRGTLLAKNDIDVTVDDIYEPIKSTKDNGSLQNFVSLFAARSGADFNWLMSQSTIGKFKDNTVTQVFTEMAKMFGAKLVVVDVPAYNGKEMGGYYDHKNNVMVLNAGRSRAMSDLFAHETFHNIYKKLSAKQQAELRTLLYKYVGVNSMGVHVNDTYKNHYVGKSDKQISEEILADMFKEAIYSKQFWKELAAKDKSLAQKIIDKFVDFINKITESFQKYFTGKNTALYEAHLLTTDLTDMIKAFANAAYVARADQYNNISKTDIEKLNQITKTGEQDNTLDNRLKKLLNKFGISVNEYDELKTSLGLNAYGIADTFNKLVSVTKDRGLDTLPEEAVHMLTYLIGKKVFDNTNVASQQTQRLYSNLYKSIDKWSGYKAIYDEYIDVYHGNESKVKKEAADKLITQYLVAKHKEKNSFVLRVIALIKSLINDMQKVLFSSPDFKAARTLAESIYSGNIAVPEKQSGYNTVNYEEALAKNPHANQINSYMESLGAQLAGSLAIAKAGENIYRPDNSIHDLDYRVSVDMYNKISKHFLSIGGIQKSNGIAALDYTTHAFIVPAEGYEIVQPEYSKKYTDTITEWKVRNKKTGQIFSKDDTTKSIAVDLFTYKNSNFKTNYNPAAETYIGKIKMMSNGIHYGRYKDQVDYVNRNVLLPYTDIGSEFLFYQTSPTITPEEAARILAIGGKPFWTNIKEVLGSIRESINKYIWADYKVPIEQRTIVDMFANNPSLAIDNAINYKAKNGRSLREFRDKLATLSNAQWIRLIDEARTGAIKKNPDAEIRAFFEVAKELSDKSFQRLVAIYPDLKQHYNANHYGMMLQWFKDSEPIEMNSFDFIRSHGDFSVIEGKLGFTKKRSGITATQMIADGYIPRLLNPYDLITNYVYETERAIEANNMFYKFSKEGMLKVGDGKSSPPEGWSYIADGFTKIIGEMKETTDNFAGTVEGWTVTDKDGFISDKVFPDKQMAQRFAKEQGNGTKVLPIRNMSEGKTRQMEVGRMMVPSGVARMLNNYISVDRIRNKKWGRILLGVKNWTTAAELCLSGFHAFAITQEYMAAMQAWGLMDKNGGMKSILVNNPFFQAGLAMANVVGIARGSKLSIAHRMLEINKLFDEVLSNNKNYNTDEFKSRVERVMGTRIDNFGDIVNAYYKGGGLRKQDSTLKFYKGHVKYGEGFVKSVQDMVNKEFLDAQSGYKGKVKASFSSVFGIGNKVMSDWLFEEYIPKVKFAVFALEYSQKLANNPNADAQSKHMMAVDSIKFNEQRFGEMNWNNLWMNRSLKTALQLVFRSFTWNYGTYAALYEGMKDVSKVSMFGKYGIFKVMPKSWGEKAKAKLGVEPNLEIQFTEKGLWFLSAITTHVFTVAMFQMALGLFGVSKDDEDDKKDAITDAMFVYTGDQKRMSIPSYPDKFYKIISHIVDAIKYKDASELTALVSGSMNGMTSTLMNMYKNENQGRRIYDPINDSTLEAAMLLAQYAATSRLPISVQTGMKKYEETGGKSWLSSAAIGLAGLTPAGKHAQYTDLEQFLLRSRTKAPPVAEDKYEHKQELIRAAKGIEEGDRTYFNELKSEGKLSKVDEKNILMRSKTLGGSENPKYQDLKTRLMKSSELETSYKALSVAKEDRNVSDAEYAKLRKLVKEKEHNIIKKGISTDRKKKLMKLKEDLGVEI